MEFRKAEMKDVETILEIVQAVITLLAKQGSPQWQNGFGPDRKRIVEDIKNGWAYVLVKGQVVAYAALVAGIDPIYTAIYDGHWLGDGQYLSIHRVAVDQNQNGQGLATRLLQALLKRAVELSYFDVRIDTHKKNIGMQKASLKAGFEYRGQIKFPYKYGERNAYQILLNHEK